MLSRLIHIAVFLTMSISLSAQLADSFDDGDFTNNPVWSGSLSNYIVTAGVLELNDGSGLTTQSFLSTSLELTNLQQKEWRIFADQNFAGSANNQSRIYIASQGPATSYTGSGSAGVQGYFIQLGEALSADVIRLFYDNGTSIELLGSGTTLIATAFNIRIRVVTDASGNWNIGVDFSGGENYVDEFSFSNNSLTSCTHFSIINTYTSSNASNFAFDDIYAGPLIVDTTPPGVVSVTAASLNSLDVLFDEIPTSLSASTVANYSVAGIGNALNAEIDALNPQLIHLTTAPFNPNTVYTLTIQNIADDAGNILEATDFDFSFLQTEQPSYRDVVINEILADPTPSVELPEAEFVELFNQHPTANFSLQDWKFVNSNTEKILPDYTLAAGQHVILCDMNNVSLFESFGTCIGITSFSALTNTGDSLTLKDANNAIIDVVVYSDDWFATDAKREGGWTLELVNPSLPCANAANWSESQDESGGTPGVVNSQYSTAPDVTPPVVLSVEALDIQTMRIRFSEPMDTSGWSSPQWEILPFNVAIDGVWSSQLDHVTLALQSPLDPAVYYELVMQGISDCSGNLISEATILFALGLAPQPGDLIINEIMADPDPTLGMPLAEYVELRNNTSSVLNIGLLTLNNGAFTDNVTLPPNGLLVVSDVENSTAFAAIPNAVFMEEFPGLTNSGLQLELKYDNVVLDRLAYSIAWYRDEEKIDGGWALERINPLAVCSGSYNWRASMSAQGGTAGTENSVFSTSSNGAPLVTDYGAINDTTLFITFSESIDTLSFLNLSGELGNSIGLSSYTWDVGSEFLTLITDAPLVAETTYTLSLVGLTDCEGNPCAAPSLDFVRGFIPVAGEIIINEIMADPSDGTFTATPGVDFIELYNKTNRLMDLTSLQVNNGFFEEQVLLYPDSFIIITDEDSDPAQFFAFPNVAYMADFPLLTEDGITLELRMHGELIETLSYSKAYYGDADSEDGGSSMERINPDDPCNSFDNWTACINPNGTSAGKANSVFSTAPDTMAPELLYVLAEPADSITLVFNEPIEPASLTNLIWSVNGADIDVSGAHLGGVESNELILGYGTMMPDQIYSFQLSGVSDCLQNEAGIVGGRFAAPRRPVAQDLIVNEILYDPFETGADFIEIFNRSGRAVALDSCAISDATDGEMNSPDFITLRKLLLMPNEYLILTKDGRQLPALYRDAVAERIWQVEGMADFSSEDVVFLLLPDGTPADRVPYNSEYHFPLLNSTDGVSLERLDSGRASDDPTNWHSASETSGFATPGYANSQTITSTEGQDILSVSPEIFSPDNDGYNDVINFIIKLTKPGYIGNLTIYDSEGRQIRHLMQNMLLGEEGAISWDGIKDDMEKAPIGVYVIYFEAFHTSGDVVQSKSSCVVAHPLN